MKRFKWLVFFLSIFLLPWNFPSSVGATLSKTILVKGLNGSVYQGALVKAIWFTDSDDGSSSIITTGADGSAQISYNSAATYGYLIVQPAYGTLEVDRKVSKGATKIITTLSNKKKISIRKGKEFQLELKGVSATRGGLVQVKAPNGYLYNVAKFSLRKGERLKTPELKFKNKGNYSIIITVGKNVKEITVRVTS